jgi:hypothetical protein
MGRLQGWHVRGSSLPRRRQPAGNDDDHHDYLRRTRQQASHIPRPCPTSPTALAAQPHFPRIMSFQHSSALESQPTTWRREDDAQYADDPEFREFASKLGDDLFALTGDVARLGAETAKLGTSKETPRVRERVRTAAEETSDKFKEIGERLKKLTTWPDVGV